MKNQVGIAVSILLVGLSWVGVIAYYKHADIKSHATLQANKRECAQREQNRLENYNDCLKLRGY